MADVIIHRGPDSDGYFISPNHECGLAFRRLAIIDLSEAGNQPMSTSDGRYTIVFNGEIYNHSKIRANLKERGYQYKSGTDTETILYGFAEWGPEITKMLYGMWAFAIWDDFEKKLFCSRDRIGIKPFYFFSKGGQFVFGSEIKTILQYTQVNKELNLRELPNYLNFGMSSNRETLFEDIRKIPAGHNLTWKSGEIKLERFWHPFANGLEYHNKDNEELQSELISLLRQSISDRMMSDVPFGVFLSGGIDSSLNVALMSELMDRPVDTFTVGFRELEKYNELEYASKISSLFKTNHHEILIDSKDCFEILDKLVWHVDEPNADPVCMPLYYLSKLTRESGTIVIQVGEGSDEQFAGYKWMLRDFNFHKDFYSRFRCLPFPVKKLFYALSEPFLSLANQPLMNEYMRRAVYDEELYWSGVPVISPYHQGKLLEPDFENLNHIPSRYGNSLHREALSLNPKADYLQRMLYTELTQRLAESLLMRVDKVTMAHSIEARVPFLDHRIVEFSMKIKPGHKVPNRKETKILLKKAVEGILPDDIIYRKKMGFAAPVAEWFRNEWYDFARDSLLNKGLSQKGYFNKIYINKLLDEHKSGKWNRNTELFSLLTLNLWYDRYFN